jgi:hypothetical protein
MTVHRAASASVLHIASCVSSPPTTQPPPWNQTTVPRDRLGA